MKIIHGGDIYTERGIPSEQLLDFSANLNPLGMPSSIKQAVVDGLDFCEAYPDPLCRTLRSRLAAQEQVPVDQIYCGNGAADIVFRLVHATKPRKAVILAPTFAEYEQALRSVDCAVVRYSLSEQNEFSLTEDFLWAIAEDIDMVFLCNPNNPTGRLTSFALVERVVQRCKNTSTILVVDECFLDFTEHGQSMKPLLMDHSHLVILKAFTKMFSMAGIRLGYCLTAHHHLIERLYQAGQPWNVSTIAQQCGIAALKELSFVKRTPAFVAVERDYLKCELEALDYHVYDGAANYLLFRCQYDDLDLRLASRGILIRPCGNYHGLTEQHYRIAVRTHEQNVQLITTLVMIEKGQ